ncbi:hypothetical protein Asi02nite_38500 [Asanoa siamensis]|uniref:Uncharacterized protein n=1 Tax=Asanoa siamensis TaxID=926357 RepID=A0ABQ4CU10_9ACTN|nr:hypothetical protein Asi02nite_38500 [Asanoa siamensis]
MNATFWSVGTRSQNGGSPGLIASRSCGVGGNGGNSGTWATYHSRVPRFGGVLGVGLTEGDTLGLGGDALGLATVTGPAMACEVQALNATSDTTASSRRTRVAGTPER